MGITNTEWKDLIGLIDEKKCTPFIGAGACVFKGEDGEPWLPLGRDIAKKWTEKYGYPFDDSGELARVAQFMAIENGDDMHPKNILRQEFRKRDPPDFSKEQYKNTPHAVLADLDLPIYITSNYDGLMESALKSRGKVPISEFCRWNGYAKAAGIESYFDKNKRYKPSITNPLVYHLHGDFNIPQSMVLTERDYLDFIVYLNREDEKKSLPSFIRQALASTSLLFIGYSMEDISFRVIFQGVMNQIGTRFQNISIAVQLPPRITPERQERAQGYLDKYTKNMFKVNVYWGDINDFILDLHKRWENYKNA